MLLRSKLLTLDAGTGRQRPRDDDESVIVIGGGSAQHGGDGITRSSSAIAEGQHIAPAARRIHVEERIIAAAQSVRIGCEHRTPEIPDVG